MILLTGFYIFSYILCFYTLVVLDDLKIRTVTRTEVATLLLVSATPAINFLFALVIWIICDEVSFLPVSDKLREAWSCWWSKPAFKDAEKLERTKK